MTILTLDFFLFVFLVFVVYYILPGKYQWTWLLVSSLFYYSYGRVWYQILAFVIFLAINYVGSVFIDPDNKSRSIIFRCVIVFDIVYFIVLKYPNFFFDLINSLTKCFSVDLSGSKLATAVAYGTELCPPCLSYFGLIVIGYLCDVYWEKISVQKNIGKYVLFSTFFPQIVSGPIVTYKAMENELFSDTKHVFSYDRTVRAIERIIWGAFKKLVVAERSAVIVNEIYNNYKNYFGLYIPFAAVMFVAQLYADFSGLMDIVIGTAELFDIKLPENFNQPFLSTNLAEFWKRWHITLGEWLQNYVLFPIARSKSYRNLHKWCKKKIGKHYERTFNLPSYISLFISWFVIGLWHGGGWNYIFGVGIYMWAIIVLSDICKPIFKKIVEILHINTECFSYVLFMRIRTFFIYAFGLSFFRAKTLSHGFKMWKRLFVMFNPWIFVNKDILNLGLDKLEWEILLIGILIILVVSIIKQKYGSVRDVIKKQNFLFRVLLFLCLFMATVIYGYYGTGFNAESFIYGRF